MVPDHEQLAMWPWVCDHIMVGKWGAANLPTLWSENEERREDCDSMISVEGLQLMTQNLEPALLFKGSVFQGHHPAGNPLTYEPLGITQHPAPHLLL